MCGVFGYVGAELDAGTLVLDALRQLEYRGYDSWGVGIGVNGHVAIQKEAGKIGTATVDFPPSSIGFGHTRWATHGGVTRENAHPHSSDNGQIAIVHNGIIENYRDLRQLLQSRGHEFHSETDSEVVVHLLDDELSEPRSADDVLAAVRKIFLQLEGLNAVVVLDRATSTLTAVKRVSPLVIGDGADGHFLASDAIALVGKVSGVAFPDDNQIVQISKDGVQAIDAGTGHPNQLEWRSLELELQSMNLNGHPHYLIKEIFEQPEVIRRIATEVLPSARQLAKEITDSYGTFLIGCGTASYAALTGSYLFSRIAERHVNFVLGSEFSYYEHFLTDRSLVVALSQSGETVDILESVLVAKEREARIAAVVNSKGSTLDRIADFSVHLSAGPELSVLSTKAYAAKVALLILTAHILDGREEQGVELVAKAAEAVSAALQPDNIQLIRETAVKIADQRSMFAIGRGLNYPTALEAALKIKEVSYIHAEGFAGGELKHGVIALIEEGTPCLAFVPNDETRGDILSGAIELKSRGGYIIGIAPQDDDVFDVHIPIADVGDASPLPMVVPAQLLGYELALVKGLDPDKPRNLAKSVTVK